jgi:two-component system chemotaxis sensor kinase CheA
MDKRDEEFLKQISETFRIEAEEHLSALTAGLIELEKMTPVDSYAEIIETMFREIHSLKGAARSVDNRNVESICQPLESIFAALKRKELTLGPTSFDLFYRTLDRLKKIISEPGSEQTIKDRQYQIELIRSLNDIATGNSPDKEIFIAKTTQVLPNVESIPVTIVADKVVADISESKIAKSIDTVRIRISKLDPLLLQAEEMTQAKKSIKQRITELQNIKTSLAEGKTEDMLSELISLMEKDKYILDSMVDNHLEAMRQVLLLPVSTMVSVLPGMVRKISKEQKKEIDFVIRGEELEIDKRILEELKDPIIHLIRNSIDHGIDKPKDRISQNKPAHGTITLDFIAKESGMVEVVLSDDGNGIDNSKVLKAAIKTGILSVGEVEKMSPSEIQALIFQSGISTSSIITDISGRGLGLSIVLEKTEKLNGRISLVSEFNKGTTFRILLPMSLATFRGILVRINDQKFIIPTLNVDRVIYVQQNQIRTVGNQETVRVGEEIISVIGLWEVLGLSNLKPAGSERTDSEPWNSEKIQIVILIAGDHRVAFKVDEVLDEQQVLVKSLGKLLARVRNISGATILGSGRVVPVLSISDLFKSSINASKKDKLTIYPEKLQNIRKKILVADDSITSRTLIKNILETAGYNVLTAVDGTDAFTKARTSEFDLIVSDVDMPRMNGFELITKIRNDLKLREVPVVLVTALGSQDDRERGIEVGADAYIIKSSFDQTNLLEIIKKLI